MENLLQVKISFNNPPQVENLHNPNQLEYMTTEETSPEVGEYKVGQYVRYIGKDEDDLPFANGDLVRLDEEDKEGFIAIPIGGDPEDGVNVYLDEIEEADEDEVDEALEADQEGEQSSYDAAKAEAANDVAEKKLKVKKAEPDKVEVAAKKKAAAPKKEVVAEETSTTKASEPEAKELVLTKGVQEALKGKSAVAAARALVKQGMISDYNLGGVLAKISRDKDYEKVVNPETGEKFEGQKGFSDFVESDLGIRYGKARYLIRFYETFSQIKGVSEEKLAAVGYAKAKEILDVVEAKPEDANKWLTDAKEEKLVDLQKKLGEAREELGIVRTPRGTTGRSGVDMVTVKFKAFNDQATIIEKAIEKAKVQIEVTDNDTDDQVRQKAIVHIFSDWLDVQG